MTPPCVGCPAVDSLRAGIEELAGITRETRDLVGGLSDDLREERIARRTERTEIIARVQELETAGNPRARNALVAAVVALATAITGLAAALQ